MLIFSIVLTDVAGNQAKLAESEGDLFYHSKAYIIIMGMAMISLLTGVVAERMSEVSSQTKEIIKDKDDEELRDFLDREMEKLEQSVRHAKVTDAGTPVHEQGLSLEEFQAFLEIPAVREKLKDLGAMLKDREVSDFFECVDRDCNGEI